MDRRSLFHCSKDSKVTHVGNFFIHQVIWSQVLPLVLGSKSVINKKNWKLANIRIAQLCFKITVVNISKRYFKQNLRQTMQLGFGRYWESLNPRPDIFDNLSATPIFICRIWLVHVKYFFKPIESRNFWRSVATLRPNFNMIESWFPGI